MSEEVAKSTHGKKLSTERYGDFVDGVTVSRHTTRKTTVILPPVKRGKAGA